MKHLPNMNKTILILLAVVTCLLACTPKPMKMVLEPLPMKYADDSRPGESFAKDPTVILECSRTTTASSFYSSTGKILDSTYYLSVCKVRFE